MSRLIYCKKKKKKKDKFYEKDASFHVQKIFWGAHSLCDLQGIED